MPDPRWFPFYSTRPKTGHSTYEIEKPTTKSGSQGEYYEKTEQDNYEKFLNVAFRKPVNCVRLAILYLEMANPFRNERFRTRFNRLLNAAFRKFLRNSCV